MRYLLIIGLAATLHAAIVTADHISIDVLAAPEPVWGVLPGQLLYRTPIVVNARLTNTGADTLFLNGIGGGSGFIPQSQIQPNTYIAGGASIEGPMFGKDLWSFTPVAWTDAEVIDGASESAGEYPFDTVWASRCMILNHAAFREGSSRIPRRPPAARPRRAYTWRVPDEGVH